MKSKMSKKLIAFILCMVLVICNSVSILADTPAPEATTTAQQTKTAGENSDTKKKTTDGTENVSAQSEDSADTKKPSDEDPAPEVKTTEKKKETTEASTEKKEDSAAANEKKDDPAEVTTKAKTDTDKTDETTTETTTGENNQETEPASETTTKAKEETTAAQTNAVNVPAELTYEDDDVKIIVTANTENAIPAGANLQVKPILEKDEETAEQYKEVVKELEAKSEKEEYAIAGFLAYDITFIDVDGNEIEPSGEVKVSMDYKKETVPEELKDEKVLADTKNVTVMHLEENAEGKVKEVVDMSQNDQLKDVKTTETKKIEKAEFVTDSFSVFTITWIRKDNGEETFNFSSQIYMVKQSYGNNYVGMTATVPNSSLTLETEDANPVLYTSTISSSGTNNQLYSVQEDNSTYRFTGAYVATKNNQYGTTYYNIAEDAQKITKLTGRKNSSKQEVMMYQLTGDTSYRNLENNECVVFVYSNESLTTNAQCYSQNGEQLSYYRNQKNVDLTGIGDRLDVRNDNNVIPNIDRYTYCYTVVGEGDNAIEVDYLRYTNGYLQYSLDGTNWSDVNSEPVKFIYKKNSSGWVPAEIETADTRGLIDIDLFNYQNKKDSWKNLDGKSTCGLTFGGAEYTNSEDVSQGLVKDTLSEGYPVTMNGNESLASLFNGTNEYTNSANTNLNHLFAYDSQTGYYSYDSDKNYAYYDTNNKNTERNFVVYERTTYKGAGKHKIGGFMPYAAYTEGGPLGTQDVYSKYGDNVADKMFLFGMKVSFDFIQPEKGLINNEDMTFRFSGDDDVWVFIDEKLVLDLGGVHDRASGSINFKTGEVIVNEDTIYEKNTNFKTIFGSDALNGDTFADNSTHHLDFFYLERGKGESNCSLYFNMPPKQSDTIEITKEITNTDRKKYANIEFSFKAYLQDEEFEDEVYEVIPEGTPYKVKKNDELTGEERTVGDGNIFKLKSGETAVFEDINPDLKYYVQEVAVDSDEFDKVEIDGWEVEYINDKGETVGTEEGDPDKVKPGQNYIAQSKPKVVGENAVIKFKNNCAESNMNELQITKYMAEGQEYQANDTFILLVELENTDGDLVPYEGEYYITQGEGNDTKYYDSNFNPIEESGAAGETKNGQIAIRVGYTVSITEIMSGTSFDVEEIELNATTYNAPTIQVQKNTAGESDVKGDNGQTVGKGSILLNQNAQVAVTNSKKVKDIYAKKVWADDSDNSKREAVKFGLFKEEKNNQNETVLSLIQVKDVADPDWKCTFENVPVKDGNNQDIVYCVKEVREVSDSEKNEPDVYALTVDGNTNYYQVIDAADEVADNDSINPYYEVEETVTGAGTQTAPYVITNTLKTFNVNVVKTGGDDALLAGVQFQLCTDADGNNPLNFTGNDGRYVYSKENTGTTSTLITVDNTGKDSKTDEYNPNLTITGLPAGKYYLIETKTAAGHSLLANPVEVNLPATNTDGEDKGYYYTETENGETTYYYDVNTFNIKNNKLFEMPEAGGRNIFLLTLAGTAMIALAGGSAIYYRRKRGVHNRRGR